MRNNYQEVVAGSKVDGDFATDEKGEELRARF